jgi:hypothetical protein
LKNQIYRPFQGLFQTAFKKEKADDVESTSSAFSIGLLLPEIAGCWSSCKAPPSLFRTPTSSPATVAL